MIQGTYYKEWSRMLGRDMEFKVYGHAGTPVLALPARGGRFYDWDQRCHIQKNQHTRRRHI